MPFPDSEYPSVIRGKDKRDSQRLLAAAPELLAALKELMALYYAGQMTLEDDNGQDPVIAGAECVIARAEGRA